MDRIGAIKLHLSPRLYLHFNLFLFLLSAQGEIKMLRRCSYFIYTIKTKQFPAEFYTTQLKTTVEFWLKIQREAQCLQRGGMGGVRPHTHWWPWGIHSGRALWGGWPRSWPLKWCHNLPKGVPTPDFEDHWVREFKLYLAAILLSNFNSLNFFLLYLYPANQP